MRIMSELFSLTPLVKPLTLDDHQVLAFVRKHYVVDELGETFNAEALFSVVSEIMRPATDAADPTVKYDQGVKDRVLPTNFEPPTQLLKRIACQMMGTQRDQDYSYAHEKTLKIIKDLEAYSWDAKVVIALAAFALEYGNFWHLSQVPKDDNLGKSLAVLNHVQAFEKSHMDISDYNRVVKNVFDTVKIVVDLESKFKKGYDEKDVPNLVEAFNDFPVFAYWTILAIVICASYIDILFGDSISTYDLSDIYSKVSDVRIKIKNHLAKILKQIAEREDYLRRLRLVLQIPTDIVQVLMALLYPREMKEPQVCQGSTGTMLSLEVFRGKHLLVFISGLSSIKDEIRLFKRIQEDLLKTEPREVDGFNKVDFKILWVPIVEEGDSDLNRKQFDYLKRQVDWYVLDYSIIPSICKKLIREKIKYQNKPIVPVFNPRGIRTNEDAMQLLFAWGIAAFPWRERDGVALNQKWNWFWTEMKKANPQIDNWIKKETYIFIYGRTDADYRDDSWLASFSDDLEKIKNDPITKKADVVISSHYHEPAETFWAFIEFLFDDLKKKTTKDPTFDEVKGFMGLRQERSGWVVLSKGSNIRLLGRGDIVVQTFQNFPSWKLDIESDPGFDVTVEKHYKIVFSKLPRPARCLHLDIKTHVSDVYVPIYCMKCNQQMQIKLVRYVCCHETADAGCEDPIIKKGAKE